MKDAPSPPEGPSTKTIKLVASVFIVIAAVVGLFFGMKLERDDAKIAMKSIQVKVKVSTKPGNLTMTDLHKLRRHRRYLQGHVLKKLAYLAKESCHIDTDDPNANIFDNCPYAFALHWLRSGIKDSAKVVRSVERTSFPQLKLPKDPESERLKKMFAKIKKHRPKKRPADWRDAAMPDFFLPVPGHPGLRIICANHRMMLSTGGNTYSCKMGNTKPTPKLKGRTVCFRSLGVCNDLHGAEWDFKLNTCLKVGGIGDLVDRNDINKLTTHRCMHVRINAISNIKMKKAGT